MNYSIRFSHVTQNLQNCKKELDANLVDKLYIAALDPSQTPNAFYDLLLKTNADWCFAAVVKISTNTLLVDCNIGDFEPSILPNIVSNYLLLPANKYLYFSETKNDLSKIVILGKNDVGASFSQTAVSLFEKLTSHFSKCVDIFNIIFDSTIEYKNLIEIMKNTNNPIGIAKPDGEILFRNSMFANIANQRSDDNDANPCYMDEIWNNLCLDAYKNGTKTHEYKLNEKVRKINFIPIFPSYNKKNIDGGYVFFEIVNDKLDHINDNFKNKFNITNSEYEILNLLKDGNDITHIADIRSTSRETVRAQLRSLRQKTGAKNQIELIGLLNHVDEFEDV